MRSSLQEEEELEHADTEITLGMRSLLGIFFGLVLICGVFFGLGYSLGRGSAKPAPPAATSSNPVSPQPTGPRVHEDNGSDDNTYTPGPDAREPINSAAASPSAAKPASPTTVVKQLTPAPDEKPVVAPPKPTPAVSSEAPAPKPASTSSAPTSTSSPSASAVPAATVTGTPSMVQIAAVSRQEDAEILVAALKKHGYNAVIRNDPKDSLLHVQIGPFSTRDDARAMRAKLLADGYNAILK